MLTLNTSGGEGIDALTIWKMSLIGWPLMALLLASCGSKELPSASTANESALYSPPTITTIPGKRYQFAEGELIGKGHKWHSDYSYRRAIIIGK